MKLSRFGERFSARTGIQELMDDLSAASPMDVRRCMLGGGNPAPIPEVSRIWRRRMEEILLKDDLFDRMVGSYDTPCGTQGFREAVAELLHREFGWPITWRNVAVTNGSQNASFFLFNMLCGSARSGERKRILFPLVPEYVGYADQSIEPDSFVSHRPLIRALGQHEFKYFIDLDTLSIDDSIGAICVSRPTNPTGNVLTDEEIRRLAKLAADHDIPLFIDNAYGTPFPHIIFTQAPPFWDEHTILDMSLSKIGLPGVRTGIVIAREDVVDALASANAIMNLAVGSIGQVLTEPLMRSGEILSLSNEIVRPFYARRSALAQSLFSEAFGEAVDYSIHASEGSIFLWVWFKNLSVTTFELYRRLKERGVFVIPGRFFFFGLDEPWSHADECIRVSYAQSEEQVRRGIAVIGDEARRLS